MTAARDEFEAMMPEPVLLRTLHAHQFPKAPFLVYGHTADQLRTAIQAADKAATERERERAARERRELLTALKDLSAMYTHAWDLVGGGLTMLPASIPLFEKRHKAAVKAIERAAAIRDGGKG